MKRSILAITDAAFGVETKASELESLPEFNSKEEAKFHARAAEDMLFSPRHDEKHLSD